MLDWLFSRKKKKVSEGLYDSNGEMNLDHLLKTHLEKRKTPKQKVSYTMRFQGKEIDKIVYLDEPIILQTGMPEIYRNGDKL